MAKRIRINNLSSINGLAVQMRAIYRLARKNTHDDDIDPATAKILTDILKVIVTTHRENELEQRIEALEKRRGVK